MNDLNIKWKDFYKNVFALVVPMALQNLINVGVTAADVVKENIKKDEAESIKKTLEAAGAVVEIK